MKNQRNILFIMFDQLRFDYLSCAGHPHLHTPNIDRIAQSGVRFTNCYVQSPICGSSRMSFYTGRYCHSHGATWNGVPLKVGEQTLGDHLRPLGMETWLVGKTHMKVDAPGLDRLGISRDGLIGARIAECGFDVYSRDDGLWADGPDGRYDKQHSPYNAYLNQLGYEGDNPWHDFANSGVDPDGQIASGFLLTNAHLEANIREEDSETPWLTTQAIEFIDEKQSSDAPWLCHLSYIKPHWPYIVPAPYHSMYGPEHIKPVNRGNSERENPHPVFEQFMNNVIGQAFQREDVRRQVIPAYMGLIKQCDDQLGRLFAHLEKNGQMQNTTIVITSDHGDYLGDHWLGEKGLFHEESVKVPLIICDPDSSADAMRGTVCDAMVESIDLAATFIELAGGDVPEHIIEGRSLLPWIHGPAPERWREYAISEYDYSMTPMSANLDITSTEAFLFMIADQRYKMIHAEGGFDPLLFDRENDPNELHNVADDPAYEAVLNRLYVALGRWSRRGSQRTTVSLDGILSMRGKSKRNGVLLGAAEPDTFPAELWSKYRGPVPRRP